MVSPSTNYPLGRRLGDHSEQAHVAHVPETVVVYNNATSHERIIDLATDLYSAGNVPRLDGPKKFRWSSKGHMHDNTSGNSTAVNNGTTNNGVYDDDGDLISGHHVPGTSS